MDYMIRGNLKNRPIRFFAISAKETIEEMKKIHSTSPNACACAGRSLMATALIGYTMKNDDDIVTTILNCDGEIKKVTCTANNRGEVKCDIINPNTNIYLNKEGKLDVKRIVGNGGLKVIKDIGLREPYVGETNIISGEIAQDYTYYFAMSEQTPSVVSLGVLVDKENFDVMVAGGLIIQMMPNASEDDIIYLENKVKELKYMTSILKEEPSLEKIIRQIFNDEELQISDKKDVKYKCNCSKEKIEKVVIALGREELEDIINKDHEITLKCHFCGKEYHLDEKELTKLMGEAYNA
ncbi:Hsp33 family molecular chaperone HslO [Anaerofustis sp.]|uniref:Hsp33 family molecular chaperone HslO n=1 Tax=Anaerofustis sp. TaxID=1872517 RepID=UPI0025C3FDC6|nr:Hsp33 family molecular chaperone HslO [Anaerofustis sp.]